MVVDDETKAMVMAAYLQEYLARQDWAGTRGERLLWEHACVVEAIQDAFISGYKAGRAEGFSSGLCVVEAE